MLAKFVPEILTVVPPAEVPLLGVTEVIFGLTAESVFIVKLTAKVFVKSSELQAEIESMQSRLIALSEFDCEVPPNKPTGLENTLAANLELGTRHSRKYSVPPADSTLIFVIEATPLPVTGSSQVVLVATVYTYTCEVALAPPPFTPVQIIGVVPLPSATM